LTERELKERKREKIEGERERKKTGSKREVRKGEKIRVRERESWKEIVGKR
jgi:hypothetical protein